MLFGFMSIFGFTPIDTAASVLGLNICQRLLEFIFLQTPLGAAAFTAGFLLSLWQSSQQAEFHSLIKFFIICVAVLLLILPSRPEGEIKSAVEQYGQTTIKSQEIKDIQINEHRIPVILSFLGQMMDAVFIGAVHAIDAVTPAWAQYGTGPFLLHQTSLRLKENIDQGIADISLKKRVDQFLYDHYLPALSMLKNDSPQFQEQQELWPGHARILAFYSPAARREWEDLQRAFQQTSRQQPILSERGRDVLQQMTGTRLEDIDQAVFKSMTAREVHELKRPIQRFSSLFWQSINWILAVFPNIYGWANMMAYAFFPFLILFLGITRHAGLLTHYLKALIWIKSWLLGGALSFYSSLIIARLQAQSSSDPFWAWEHPYYCVGAVIGLLLMPTATFFIINKGGNTWGI